MKKAFTLMEVNLAIMIMAGGVLTVLGLYGLGYRETRQSREDIVATSYADAVLSPLVTALSSTNVTWETFSQIKNMPSARGWGDYLDAKGFVSDDPEPLAKSAYNSIIGGKVGSESGVKASWPTPASGNLRGGLVIMHDEGSAVVRLAFRAARDRQDLLAMPINYTEVRFQGVTKPLDTNEKKK